MRLLGGGFETYLMPDTKNAFQLVQLIAAMIDACTLNLSPLTGKLQLRYFKPVMPFSFSHAFFQCLSVGHANACADRKLCVVCAFSSSHGEDA